MKDCKEVFWYFFISKWVAFDALIINKSFKGFVFALKISLIGGFFFIVFSNFYYLKWNLKALGDYFYADLLLVSETLKLFSKVSTCQMLSNFGIKFLFVQIGQLELGL